ncbi:MAG: hypothetical protein PHX70_03025 [Clostridium sp.]|nr:hypothetical protein [Clostridium sp.]
MAAHKKHHHVQNEQPADNFPINFENIIKTMGSVNLGEIASILDSMGSKTGENKTRADIINSIKTIVNSDKAELISILIEAYGLSRSNQKK